MIGDEEECEKGVRRDEWKRKEERPVIVMYHTLSPTLELRSSFPFSSSLFPPFALHSSSSHDFFTEGGGAVNDAELLTVNSLEQWSLHDERATTPHHSDHTPVPHSLPPFIHSLTPSIDGAVHCLVPSSSH
jgi:hypothetical protein